MIAHNHEAITTINVPDSHMRTRRWHMYRAVPRRRKGSSEDFLRQLFAFAPLRVVYVSCNPATQLRDLKLFDSAGYSLKKTRPFDLFPQTKHLECVMTLAR